MDFWPRGLRIFVGFISPVNFVFSCVFSVVCFLFFLLRRLQLAGFILRAIFGEKRRTQRENPKDEENCF